MRKQYDYFTTLGYVYIINTPTHLSDVLQQSSNYHHYKISTATCITDNVTAEYYQYSNGGGGLQFLCSYNNSLRPVSVAN